MKKRWLILTVICLVLLAIFLSLLRSAQAPSAIQFQFVGYTNATTFTGAVFRIEFPEDFSGCGWGDARVSRKDGSQWKQFTPTNSNIPMVSFFSHLIKTSKPGVQKSETYIVFHVETTNAVSRVMIEVDEYPPRTPFNLVIKTLRTWLGEPPGNTDRIHYSITNETRIISSE